MKAEGEGESRERLDWVNRTLREDWEQVIIISEDTRISLNYARITPTLTLVCV